MSKVMRNEKVIAMIIAIMALLASFAIPVASVEAKGPEITSVWPSMPPVIDGEASAEEWGDAASINLTYGLPKWTYGYMLVQNDAANLYLLIDLTLDISENEPYKGVTSADYFELSFDLDQPRVINYPRIDFMYFPIPNKLAKAYYTGPFEQWEDGEPIHSQLGVGFNSSLNSETDHRIWELAISLTEINAVPGELVRLGLRTHSDDPPFQYDQPENLHGDFSNHTEITLASRQVELLVLAHKDFCPALELLKDHKELTGMSTYIQSWQSLDQSFYFEGDDEPERIKKGIAAYEMNCGTEYVMLVGDIDRFPARYTYWGWPTQRGWSVTDLYYADLYVHGRRDFDDWDGKDNGLYGEILFEPDGPINGDGIDVLPDVAVGRIPASTVAEVTAYVNKVIAYELNTSPTDTWFKTAGLYTGNWTPACNVPCSADISVSLTNQGFNVIERYWNWTTDQPPANVPGVIINDMNEGMGFVNYCGHGWSSGGGWACLRLGTEDLSGLTNSGRLPIVFAAACDTGRFAYLLPCAPYVDVKGDPHCGTCPAFGNVTIEYGDYPHYDELRPAPLQGDIDEGVFCPTTGRTYSFDPSCIAETFIFGHSDGSPGSGAIAYLGAKSSANYAPDLAPYFFEAYDEGDCRVLGDMWKYMVEEYYDFHDLAESYKDYVEPVGTNWGVGHEFAEPRKFTLFGDPSVRVGGVGDYYKLDFSDTYDIVHDGLEGTLELVAGSDDPDCVLSNMSGNYTSAAGQQHHAYGLVRSWGQPMPEDWGPNHKIEFYIDFEGTPTHSDDDQEFEGYHFTQANDAMAGITWSWDTPDIPYGFYALKEGFISRGASSASGPVTVQDFVGSYYMNHDGWEGTLVLLEAQGAQGDWPPDLTGLYYSTDPDEPERDVRGYLKTSAVSPQAWGPEHKIEFYIDLAGTPNNPDDDLQFEGYLFTETKDAMAGMFWVNDTPFGFYALNQASTTSTPGTPGDCGMPTAADTMPLALISVTLVGLWARRWRGTG